MKLQRTRLPLGIFAFVLLFVGIKTYFNQSSHPRIDDDGSVFYKKSGEGDNYLYKITEDIAFEASLLPTMGAISIDVVRYEKIGGLEGVFIGKNKKTERLFNPTNLKEDWVYTSYGKQGDYFAVNIKTGELLKNTYGSDELYTTDEYKGRFSGGGLLKDEYILQNFEYISTYKESGTAILWAGIFLAPICLIWAIIAFVLDRRKPKLLSQSPANDGGNRAP